MGRSRGGGGGSSRRSSGGSRRSSSRSHSSSRSSSRSSSFSSGSNRNYSRPSFGGPSPSRRPSPPPGPRPSYSYNPPPPRPYGRTTYHHHHYSNAPVGGVARTINKIYAIWFLLVFFFIVSCAVIPSLFNTSYYANQIDEEAVAEYAESRYTFDDESHLLLFYTYLEKSDTDYATLVFGYDASDIISTDLEDYFWEVYDDNFYSDLNDSQWLGYTFAEIAEEYEKTSDGTKLTDLKNFNKDCYEDGLDFIMTNERKDLIDGCEKFFDATGIQVHIILMDYEDIPGVTIQESTAGRFGNRVLTIAIIAAVAVVGIIIVKKIIAKKKKEEEDMERILNTPLEKFEDTKTEELKDKYDQ